MRRLEIVGSSERDVDRVIAPDDYFTIESLLALVDRLHQTEQGEQFLFREVEMDCAFRQADGAWKSAARVPASPEQLLYREQIRALIFDAHDFVGVQDLEGAVAKLHDVMDLMMQNQELV